ncbi:hypothetical protein XYCOK13_16690 [Xylanibacillus composti]|uniref:LytTR family transcriptional regulator n=1 Tax=Xylanibacillus composti TaxID=1572762 RepID=A0A8J4H396_9BACL|nr:hypothetical protein [Xylanibacillus composti]GIQ68845.1 hypothetical protein XYCOK13_16690 [Xylanibacillus composti]
MPEHYTEKEMNHVRIPVMLRDSSNGGKGQFRFLRLDEICSVSTDGRTLLFETRDATYHMISTLDQVGQFLMPLLDLKKVDRVNYIQPSKVTYYDSEFRKVYFDKQISAKSRYATIAQRYMELVRTLVGKDKDLARTP